MVRKCFFLLIIAVVCFSLRYWGMMWGLPETYHADEPYMLAFTKNFIHGNWNPVTFEKRPFIYGPVVMAVTAIVAKLLTAINLVFKITLPEQYNVLFLGRLIVIICAVINAFLVYKFACLFISTNAAMLSSLIFSLSYTHIIHSHYYTTDVPLALLVTLVLYYSQKILTNPQMKYYQIACVFAVLAFCTKFSAILVCVPVLIAHICSCQESGSFFRNLFNKKLIIFGIIFLVLSTAILHYIIFPFSNISAALTQLQRNAEVIRRAEWGCVYPNRFIYYLWLIWVYFKPFMGVAAIVGCVVFYLKFKRNSLPALSFIVLYFVAHSIARNFSDRYLLPLIPIFAILIGIVLSSLFNYGKSRVALRSTVVLIVVVQLVISFYYAARADFIFTLPDTRVLAAPWVRTYLAPDVRIASEQQGPRVENVRVPKLYKEDNEFFMKKRIDYLIHSTLFDESFLSMVKCNEREQYYQNLINENTLVKTFWLESIGFLHPTMQIIRTAWLNAPPFFKIKIQPLFDLHENPITFLDTIWAGSEAGGFMVTQEGVWKSFISAEPLDTVQVYLANQNTTQDSVTINSGISNEVINLGPYEKKIVKMKVSLSFPYMNYFYQINLRSDKNEKIYARLILDPFNEALVQWHLQKKEIAISKLQSALSAEKDNPLVKYLLGLCYYDTHRVEVASEIIEELGDDWLKSFLILKMPLADKKGLPRVMNFYSMPPGYFILRLSVESEEPDNAQIMLKSDEGFLKMFMIQKGNNILVMPFKVSHIGNVVGEMAAEHLDKMNIKNVAVILDRKALLESLEEGKELFSVFPPEL